MTSEVPLSPRDIKMLRETKMLSETETAVKIGSDIVAIDIVTQDRRILHVEGVLLETTRRILKD